MDSTMMKTEDIVRENDEQRLARLAGDLKKLGVITDDESLQRVMGTMSRHFMKRSWTAGDSWVLSAEYYQYKVSRNSWQYLAQKVLNPDPCPYTAPKKKFGPPYSAALLKYSYKEQAASAAVQAERSFLGTARSVSRCSSGATPRCGSSWLLFSQLVGNSDIVLVCEKEEV